MIQCVFINTDQQPVKIKRSGFFHVREEPFSHQKNVTELCEVFYPHPDAPKYALISVFKFLEVGEISHELIPSIEGAEKALKGFRFISKLVAYPNIPTDQEN